LADHDPTSRPGPTGVLLLHAGAIVVVWAATHLFSLSWGLPNRVTFAVDAAPMRTMSTARDMMAAHAKYPPLQYLIWNTCCPPPAEKPASLEEDERVFSRRLFGFRLIVAVMTLGTAFALYALGRLALMGGLAVVPPLLFTLNPMSVYYSHTTNMDQPYVFWFAASVLVFCLTNIGKAGGRRRWLFGNIGFGAIVGCALCTIEPPVRRIFTLFTRTSPTLAIYGTRSKDPSVTPSEITLGFEEQLQVLEHCIRYGNRARTLRIFGKLGGDFREPDIASYDLSPDTVELAATAYDENGRVESARKAFEFLLARTDQPRYRASAARFFEKHGISKRRKEESSSRVPPR
jgi:hypothetical protein